MPATSHVPRQRRPRTAAPSRADLRQLQNAECCRRGSQGAGQSADRDGQAEDTGQTENAVGAHHAKTQAARAEAHPAGDDDVRGPAPRVPRHRCPGLWPGRILRQGGADGRLWGSR